MNAERAKEVHRIFVEEALLKGEFAPLDELVAEDHYLHQNALAGMNRSGPAALRTTIKLARLGLKNLSIRVVEQIAADDLVVTRFTAEATHEGRLGIFAPSNRTMRFTGIVETRFENERAIESWLELDTLGLLSGLVRVERIVAQIES